MITKFTSPLLLLFALCLLCTNSWAQSIAVQSVNSCGTKMTQSNGSLSFTVGELVVNLQTDNLGNTINGGFTSGATISTVSVSEPDPIVLDVKVFPNPTTDLVNVQVNHTSLEQLELSVIDMLGKEVFYGKYAGISNIIGINMSPYASGTYFLNIKNTSNEPLGSFKIIKR